MSSLDAVPSDKMQMLPATAIAFQASPFQVNVETPRDKQHISDCREDQIMPASSSLENDSQKMEAGQL